MKWLLAKTLGVVAIIFAIALGLLGVMGIMILAGLIKELEKML